jgi:hypothetical protein
MVAPLGVWTSEVCTRSRASNCRTAPTAGEPFGGKNGGTASQSSRLSSSTISSSASDGAISWSICQPSRARPIAAMGKSRATYYRQHRQSPAAPRPSRERAGQPPLDKDRPPQCSGASISRWLLVHSRGKPSLALKFLATAEARTQSRTSRGPAPRTSMLYESSVLSSSTW